MSLQKGETMDVKNVSGFSGPIVALYNEKIESEDKVSLWVQYKEYLLALFKDKLITSSELYLMTIAIRKRLGLFVIS